MFPTIFDSYFHKIIAIKQAIFEGKQIEESMWMGIRQGMDQYGSIGDFFKCRVNRILLSYRASAMSNHLQMPECLYSPLQGLEKQPATTYHLR